jgi:DNA-binding HxlR family transcriptional regulator
MGTGNLLLADKWETQVWRTEKTTSYLTERMLTLQLRKLEENKIITRTIYAEIPPRVEYELTPIGYELKTIIKQLESWGEKHKALG